MLVVAVFGCWVATAWLCRDLRPWAIRWSDTFVAVSLAVTYGALGALYVLWATGCRRRSLFRAAAVTLTGLMIVVLLEITAVIGAVDYFGIWLRLGGDWGGPMMAFQEDSSLSFRRPPNFRWSGRPLSDMAIKWNLPFRASESLSFTTDSKGYRNLRELDRADIVLLGDSYVEGHWVSDENTCAVILEKRLGLSVANLAVAGYGSLQQLEVLKRDGLELRPRLVAWFFFEGNDLYDDEAFENAMLYYQGKAGRKKKAREKATTISWRKWYRRSFTRQAFRALRRLCHPVVPINAGAFGWYRDLAGRQRRLYFHDYPKLTFGDFERRRFEKTKAALREAGQRCRMAGARLVLFYVPTKFRVYGDLCRFPPGSRCRKWTPWDLPSHFAEFCAEAGIPFVDLGERMRAAAAEGRVLYAPEDSHWSPEGHHFVADILESVWEELGSRK